MKHSKKLLRMGLPAALFCLGLSACGSAAKGPYAGHTLHVYNWGEYTGDDLIPDFEVLTGAKVVTDSYDSNEQMYIKVANGDAFDILVPSDYMIERLIAENRLQKLDHSKITVMDELAEGAKDLPYDPGNEYSVPWYWGTVGIAYDKTKVSEEELSAQGFNIFLNPKYAGEIYLYDSERDAFMMALKALGYSMNTTEETELTEACEWLLQCVETMQPEIVLDEIIDNMAQGRKALGLVYSGDATYITEENPEIGYFLPEGGTNLWTDAMVIPENAPEPELAYEFINFVSGYEGALDNALGIGYTPPNLAVMEELSGPGGEYEGLDSFLPRSGYPGDEVFHYDDTTRKIMADLWSKVKIAASNKR